MKAPKWIADSVQAADIDGCCISNVESDALAHELLERLPIEAMVKAGATGPGVDETIPLELRMLASRRIVERSVAALAGDHDVVPITELYRSASARLDAAGVPYGTMTGVTHRVFTLPERIVWLAKERPTRIDLERAKAETRAQAADEREAARKAAEYAKLEIESLNDALIAQRDAFEELVAELREQVDEARKDMEHAVRASQHARRDLEDELYRARGELERLEARSGR